MIIPLLSLSLAQGGVSLRQEGLNPGAACSDTFIAHPLEHTTRAHQAEVTFYDSNGAGVAAGDLDNDGDIDLVLANLKGENALFWNEGGLRFRREALSHGESRGVAVVDVDGDGWLDVVFTQNLASLSFWRNREGSLQRDGLRGVTLPAYAMAWGDLDGDGDLDLVTASYDTLLEKELKDTFLFSSGAGVVVYSNAPDGFTAERLADSSQALALALFDFSGDGRPDIVVGNDFEIPDFAFVNTPSGWLATAPFTTTTRNTMSFAAGDIDNDGVSELFATDMKPVPDDEGALAAWQPLMEMMAGHQAAGDGVQIEENVLYRRAGTGFDNLADSLGIGATGWSWSGKFGDLDNDGHLDLYVVNGMIAKELLAHMPNAELVEENQAFRQTEAGFTPAPAWGLGATQSGRGMTMADLDGDGDLDIVVNNLESPALVFENRLCGGVGLEVDLFWPASGNTRALGATVFLHLGELTLSREVQSGSGYLSGDPPRVHFGIPAGTAVDGLEIVWPDGRRHAFYDIHPGTRLHVTREDPR